MFSVITKSFATVPLLVTTADVNAAGGVHQGVLPHASAKLLPISCEKIIAS